NDHKRTLREEPSGSLINVRKLVLHCHLIRGTKAFTEIFSSQRNRCGRTHNSPPLPACYRRKDADSISLSQGTIEFTGLLPIHEYHLSEFKGNVEMLEQRVNRSSVFESDCGFAPG